MGKTLSATIINYNHGKYLRQSLSGVCSQSRKPDEFVIVDDGSTDDSHSIIDEFANRYSFIRVFRHATNRGVIAATETALSNTTGDYLFGGAADDYACAGFFYLCMKHLESHPDAGLACGYFSIEKQDGSLWVNKSHWCSKTKFFTPEEVSRIKWLSGIPGHATIVRRDAFNKVGYRPNLSYATDWFTNLVLAFRHGMIHIPEKLAVFRSLETSYSGSQKNNLAYRAKVFNTIVQTLQLPEFADVADLFHSSGVLRGQDPA